MGVLTWFLFASLGCLGAIALNMLASELWAEAAGLSRWIVRKAVLLLPAADRESRNAEWLAHVEDRAGNLRKVLCALGCVRAALALAEAEKRPAEELTLNLDYIITGAVYMSIGSSVEAFYKFSSHDGIVSVGLAAFQLLVALNVLLAFLFQRRKGKFIKLGAKRPD